MAYDFTYDDMGPLDEEIDEWFFYHRSQWVRLHSAQKAYDDQWYHKFGGARSWNEVDEEMRENFVITSLEDLTSSDSDQRAKSLSRVVYLVLGRWMETAGGSARGFGSHQNQSLDSKARSASTPTQLAAMKAAVKLIGDVGGVEMMWNALRKAFDPFWCVELVA